MSTPTRNIERPMSPLRSPILRRRLSDDDIDIHYPAQFLPKRPIYKQSLIGEDGHFRTALDVHDFEISEISVKTVGHTILGKLHQALKLWTDYFSEHHFIVTCQHAEKEDPHGTVERNFTKKYILPLDLDMPAIRTKISKGVLYIKVPPKAPEQPQVRHVEIKME